MVQKSSWRWSVEAYRKCPEEWMKLKITSLAIQTERNHHMEALEVMHMKCHTWFLIVIFLVHLKKFCSLRQWAQVCIDGTVCLQLHQLAARLELVAIFIGGSEAIWVLRVLQFWNLLEVYCLIWIMKKPTRLKKSCLENLLWVISTQEYLQTCTMEWWPFRDFGKSTCEGVV